MKYGESGYVDLPKSDEGFSIDDIAVLDTRLRVLEEKAVRVDQRIGQAERRIKSATTFVMFVVGAIGIATFLMVIPVWLDYFKHNEDRFEKNTRQVQELEARFQERYETKEHLEQYKAQSDDVSGVVNCIRSKGFFSIQCF